jgi:beta-RFAP synthase
MKGMISVRTYSRLHFGLLNPWTEGAADSQEPAPRRVFGSVGMMVERPSLRLRIEPSASWVASGSLAARALAFAQRFALASHQEERDRNLPARHLLIEQAVPEHIGLGSGTQLGLAVASALAASWGLQCDLATLARRVGRGLRSALGAHGFAQGGLLVEAGKSAANRLAPLVARLLFPEAWRLVLVLPGEGCRVGIHGDREVEAFAQLATRPAPPERTDVLCRLVLLGLLPALVERDLEVFGESVYEFNRRVGEAFAPVQDGIYSSPRVAELVAFVRARGIAGVGQSSWGPTVFAVVADNDHAEFLAAHLRRHFGLANDTVMVTPACNHGALMEAIGEQPA